MGTGFPNPSTSIGTGPTNSNASCHSLELASTPNNRERHPLSLAARWGGVSDYERLMWPRQTRGYLMLLQVTPKTRFGVFTLGKRG